MRTSSASALAAFVLAGTTLINVVSLALAANESASSTATVSNPHHCKVVERKPGDHTVSGTNSAGGLSTSVAAGNGKVSAQSSGGNSVTVNSGNGSTSSSVSTTGSGGHSTTVASGDGNCVIYVDPGTKVKEK